MGFLRTILAITVVLAHSPWNDGFVLVGGRNAVQMFYMISGFLISHIILTNPIYRNPFTFYANRALRLYPIYYTVAVLAFIVNLMASEKFFSIYKNSPITADILLVLSNLLLFGQDWVMFSGVRNGHLVFTTDWRQSDIPLYQALLVPQAWTLGIELSFYILAPFLLRKVHIIILFIVVSLLVRGGLVYYGIGLKDPWSYRFFPSELSLFLFGALSNRYLLPFWSRHIAECNHDWLVFAGTSLIIISSIVYFMIPLSEPLKTITLLSVFILLLPLCFIFQSKSKIDKFVGELSYPIYIGHVLVITVIATLVRHQILANELVISIVNVSCSIIFAYFLNLFIGRPIEKFRMMIKGG